MKQLILENKESIAKQLEILDTTDKVDPHIHDWQHVDHNQGWDRSVDLSYIENIIIPDTKQIAITGRDTYNRLAIIMATLYNDNHEISLDYLKKTITKSNVILLNGSLYPLENLIIFDISIISIDNIIQDTISRIYIMNQNNFKYIDNKMTLEFSKKNKLGIIKDLM